MTSLSEKFLARMRSALGGDSHRQGLVKSEDARAEEVPEEWRMNYYPDSGLADYITRAKYTRFQLALGRRETYAEAVARVVAMHRRFLGGKLQRRISGDLFSTPVTPADAHIVFDELAGATIDELLTRAFAAVTDKRVLPSMRSLQFCGEAILRNHARLFNCGYSPADRIDFFREYFFLLLSGVGCGFSVQKHHTELLPVLPLRNSRTQLREEVHCVADTIEGWADALGCLVRSHYEGFKVEFDFSDIRPCGRALVVSGGIAPGPEPLKRALEEVETILYYASGQRLQPIEIYDICMFLSRATLSSGVRRAASLCLFSADDVEMMNAKTGDWMVREPQRAASNNSAVISPKSGDRALFDRLFNAQKAFGDPGFFFTEHPDYGCNPCAEAGFHPVLTEPLDEAEVTRLWKLGYAGELPPNARLSGWGLCNLSTIDGAEVRSADDFYRACVYASVIGTVQAGYTNLSYLGPVTRYLAERDALLGVSICGFMDTPGILFSPHVLERGARLCRATNQLVAAALGLRKASRVTCVKPEGTAALLLGAAPGIHPHYARHYFRRVRASREEPVCRIFRAHNPKMVEQDQFGHDGGWVMTFPVTVPLHAVVRDDLSAGQFLDRVRLVRQHWVLPGEDPLTRSPGLHHNVSHTCSVRPDEWAMVADTIWERRADCSGVKLLAYDGGKVFPQPPFEAVTNDEAVQLWNKLSYQPVDYAAMEESSDTPALADTSPCVDGACDAP